MLTTLKFRLAAGIVTFAAAAAAPCYAQSSAPSTSWMGGRMDTNLYIGGNVGQTRFSTSCDGVPVSCDDKDTGGKIFAGYQFHPNFAVEAGHFRLGDATATGIVGGVPVSVEANVRGWELVGVARIPVWQQLSLFGKAGVARSRVSVIGTAAVGGSLFTVAAKENSTDFTFGAGAEYAFTRNIAARAEWQRYDSVGGGSTGKDDLDFFSAGLLYRF